VLLYEFPFNENVRTLLRLEHLFDRLAQLAGREPALDHHFALVTLFEIIEVTQRSDLKGELMKELERHKAQLNAWRGNPNVSAAVLDGLFAQLDAAFQGLNRMQGKPGALMASSDMLNTLRSRIAIPGGTCEFDIPAYHAWAESPVAQRRNDLIQWMNPVLPLAQAVQLLLQLLRESGQATKVATSGGQYQQSLNANRNYGLLRLRIDAALGLVPEIMGHRLMVSIRLLRQDAEGRLRLAQDADTTLELSFCG
jgi:cell division protein ZapD